MFKFVIIFAWLCLAPSRPYTITSAGTPAFPRQQAHTTPGTFLRTAANATLVRGCPPGFAFSARRLKCVRAPAASARPASSPPCPPSFRGLLPNPLNCRGYYSCWDGLGFELECSDQLLYDERRGRCEWPKSAGCCEYREVNSGVIVQTS